MRPFSRIFPLLLFLAIIRCSRDRITGGAGGGSEVVALTGTAVDKNGRPLSQARMILFSVAPEFRDSLFAEFAAETTYTDDSGAFAFDDLAPGRYSLEAAQRETGLRAFRGDVVFAADSQQSLGSVILTRPGAFAGVIAAARGISARVGLERTPYRVWADSAGTYRLSDVPEGAYSVTIRVIDQLLPEQVFDYADSTNIHSDSVSILDTVVVSHTYVRTPLAHVTINTTASGFPLAQDVHAFPLLIRLDSTNYAFPPVTAGGQTVTIGRGAADLLPLEIERWDDGAKRAEIWVLMDTIRANAVQACTLYWGGVAFTSPSVFDTSLGFRGVWHLGDSGIGEGGLYRDATPLQHHGRDSVTAAGREGVIGLGQEFDGIDDRIAIEPRIEMNGPITVSAWVKVRYIPTDSTGFRIFGTYDVRTDSTYGFQLFTYRSDIVFKTGDGRPTNGAAAWQRLAAGQWLHLAAVYQNTGIVNLYLNGTKLNMNDSTASPRIDFTGTRTYISSPRNFPFDGFLDEVRVMNAVPPEAWLRLDYESQHPDQKLVRVEGVFR